MNSTRKKFIIAGLLLLSVIALFCLLVLTPLVQGVRADASKLVIQRQERVQVETLEQDLLSYQELKNDSAAAFFQLEQLFIDPETPISFIEFLEDIAREAGFELKIVPGVAKQEKGAVWPSASYQLSSEGPYPGFFIFLEKLEAAPYLLNVKNISISGARGSVEDLEGADSVQFTVLLKVFTRPLP